MKGKMEKKMKKNSEEINVSEYGIRNAEKSLYVL